nr:uncharacterized protein LOC106618301 [Bactrocera oleae]
MLSTRKDKKFLYEFMNNRDVPAWYRGISPFQLEAADELANSIRDDVAQETSHRVHNCLSRLGLIPAVRDKDLKMLMKLSGGNDLAFLWFLMELYYKKPGVEYKSLNEQLILTSIAHLDMITTLRELDNILPPGHQSKRQLEKRRKQKLRDKSWQSPPQKLMKKHSSPYFNKLERPVQYGKPLEVERPDFKVKFFRYEIYKDPNYVPPNEDNRWYAKHSFNRAKRISNKTIRDVLNNLSDNLEFIPTISNRAMEVIDYALSGVHEVKSKVLCKKHQNEAEQAKLRRTEFMLKKREKCFASLELFKKKKEARLERIQKMLETEVEMYRLHYHKKLQSHKDYHSYIRVLGKEGYCEHLIEDDQDENCNDIGPCPKTPSLLSMAASRTSRYNQLSDSKLNGLSKVESLLMNRGHRLSFGQRESETQQFHNISPTPPSSECYFVGPTKNQPYHFSYTKIFRYKDENDKRLFIKDKCVEAMETKDQLVPKLEDLTPDLAKLAKKSANQTWNENQKAWRKANEHNDLQESIQTDPYPPDMPRLPFYDCEDKKLMNDMLRIALVEMRKNPKYVLASLPDVHKLPMLREWIYQRYGKRYTHAQRIKEFNESIRIMNVLQKLKLRTVLPQPYEIGTKFLQSYKCHKYIMKKVGIARRQFYDRVNSDLLKRARYFWFAMRIPLCALPTRATFFAYLPARRVDNYLFKPWKLAERMDAKAQWDKKRHMEKQNSCITMFLQNYAKPTTNWVARDMQRQREFVDKYMRSIDVPDWYRGLSSFQYRAARNLLYAIRDDLEQDTSHRVREILNTIGLRPPLSKKNVRFVMKLSRGNDLAFLWFLKDLYYTTQEPGYNTNEQLILSCIAYLDLIFTIRGLDNLLPTGQPPKKTPPKRKMSKIVIDRLSRRKLQYSRLLPRKLTKQTGSFNKQYKLPYLERQRRPRPFGKSLTAYPPENVIQLKFLEVFKDPNYVIPNESSRWFSNYEPNEGRKTANSLVNQSLNEIFKSNLIKIPSQVFDAQLFKKLRLSGTSLRKNSQHELGRNILCEHHKVMQEMEKNLELELRMIALEKCRKYFDLDIPKKEKRVARLRRQIENDVNLHLLRFRQLADKSRSQLLLWDKNDLHVCNLSNDANNIEKESCNLCMSQKLQCHSTQTQSDCNFGLKPKICNSTQKKTLSAKSENKIRTKNLRNVTEPEIIGDCLRNNHLGNHKTQSRKSSLTNAHCGCRNVCKPKVYNCDSNYDYMQNYDYGHSDTSSETKAFFNAPHKHSPFKFDYQKIFDIAFEQEDAINIKKTCVAAIRSEECLKNHHAESRENIDEAIKNCTMKTMENTFRKSRTNVEYDTVPLLPSAKANTYYDPNNKALMHQMLKEGIERLAKDTRYVLAALPDAHKLPILRYWIYQRYGKVYTQKELIEIFKSSTLLFRALLQIQIHEALPSPTDLGRAVFIDYSCHSYLMRKCDRIKDLFYKRVDKAIMDQSRHLYIAMTPYVYAGRSPNKTIFAYLPSRPNDIQHFRVWSPRDCKPRWAKSTKFPGQ